MTFAEEIEKAACGEILAAVVEGSGWGNRSRPDGPGTLMEWADARELLDYEYDSGYGGVECHTFTAWTADRVLFTGTYDGATWVESVPRHPVPAPAADIVGG